LVREARVFRFFRKRKEPRTETPPRGGLFAAAAPEPRAGRTATTVLAAHLAGCDGEPNAEEREGFARLFRFSPEARPEQAALFARYHKDKQAFQPFAVQLLQLHGRGSAALEDLIERLYRLALVDGSPTSQESAFLDDLCEVFGLPGYWRRVDALHAQEDDPYRVLGIPRDASDRDVRTAFRRLTRQYHPDAVMARGGAPDEAAPMAAINAAYRRVMRWRRGG